MMYLSISDFAEKFLANKNTVAVHGYVFIVKSVNEHWFSGALVQVSLMSMAFHDQKASTFKYR